MRNGPGVDNDNKKALGIDADIVPPLFGHTCSLEV